MTNFVQLMSAISAFGAAALWLYASRIKTPESFPISIPSMHIYSDTVVGSQVGGSTNGSTAELDALADDLREQSRWNSYAAGCAAVSAACQSVLYFFPSCSN